MTPTDRPRSPRVGVVVPTHRGEEWLGECLDSLAGQSLPFDDFEIVVVENGPRGAVDRLVAQIAEQHRGLRIIHVHSQVASLPAARNLGLDHVAARYVTFVDDDDRVGPRFLEAMLAYAAPDAVVATLVGTVRDGAFDRPDFDNVFARALLPHVGRAATTTDLRQALCCPWAKLVRTDLARQVRFDPALHAEEDLVFWLSVMAAEPVRLVLGELAEDAAYLYHQRPGSLMQLGVEPTWDLNVERRMAPLLAWDRMAITDPELLSIRHGMQAIALARVRRYVEHRPDERLRVEAALTACGMRHTPWREILDGRPWREYLFAGRGAREESATVRARGAHLDVLSHEQVIRDWAAFDAYALETVTEAMARSAEPGGHRVVHSVSADPAQHLAAALVTIIWPDLPWHAHLLPGGESFTVVAAETLEVLRAGLVEAGYAGDTLPEDAAALVRLLADHLADEVVDRTVGPSGVATV